MESWRWMWCHDPTEPSRPSMRCRPSYPRCDASENPQRTRGATDPIMGAKVRHNRDNRRQPEASTWNLPSNGINQIHNSPVPVAASQAERPGCNFGVVAFASQWIILDTDIKPDPTRPEQTAEQARAKARAMRAELFKSWGMNPTRYRMFNPPAAA